MRSYKNIAECGKQCQHIVLKNSITFIKKENAFFIFLHVHTKGAYFACFNLRICIFTRKNDCKTADRCQQAVCDCRKHIIGCMNKYV
jgi:hypothetical protein